MCAAGYIVIYDFLQDITPMVAGDDDVKHIP